LIIEFTIVAERKKRLEFLDGETIAIEI